MKTKISISIDEETLKEIDAKLKEDLYRNKSHFIELAAKKYLQELVGKDGI